MKHLFDLRAKDIADQRAILDTAQKEARGLTPEERVTVGKLDVAIDGYTADIETAQKADERAKLLATPNPPRVGLQPHADNDDSGDEPTAEQRAVAFDKWLRFGPTELDATERRILNPQHDKRARGSVIDIRIRSPYLSPAFRAAQGVGSGAIGGFTVPEGFVAAYERSLLTFGGMRQVSRILPTESGNDLPWPTVNDTAQTGELLAENTAAAQQDITFAQIILKAYKYSSKEVLVPQELLEDSGVNIDALVGSLLGERIARITNTHFTTGDNSGKPQGAVTGSGLGKTAASATAVTADELIDLQDSVDDAYSSGPNVFWMFKKTSLTAVRKLKTTDLQYIWAPGAVGIPPTLFGKPYVVNQDMPAMTTGLKSFLFGDFSKYIIRDVASFRLRRLVERYAEKDQVSFIAFSRHDGRVLDAGTDPIKHLIQA